MGKLTSYVGLVTAMSLLLTIVPLGRTSDPDMDPAPFFSLASRATVRLHPQAQFWRDDGAGLAGNLKRLRLWHYEARYRFACHGVNTADSVSPNEVDECFQALSMHGIDDKSMRFVEQYQHEIDAYAPNLYELLTNYNTAWRAGLALTSAWKSLLGFNINSIRAWSASASPRRGASETTAENRSTDEERSPGARITELRAAAARMEEFEPKVVRALESYAADKKPGVVATIYAIHALLLLMVGLAIKHRHAVGALVLLPFTRLAQAIKGIHEQV